MNIITSNKAIIYVDPEGFISGGNITINGKTYENVIPASYNGEMPPDIATPEKYIFENGEIILNPDTEGNDINTRLNDIEQILIELLDTI